MAAGSYKLRIPAVITMSKDDVAKQEKKAAKKAAKAAAAAAAATGADASAMSVDPDNTTASAVVVDPSSSTAAGASGEDKKKSKKRKSEALDGDDEADDVPIDLSTLSPIARELSRLASHLGESAFVLTVLHRYPLNRATGG